MTKGKHGNKEAKKPKKAALPNTPLLPAGTSALAIAPAPARAKKH
jgi:hypothetical protein